METKAGSRHSAEDMNLLRRARVQSMKSYETMQTLIKALGDDGAEPHPLGDLATTKNEYKPNQIAQINAMDSIVSEYGKFGKSIFESHYIPANMNGFLQSGLACSSCAYYNPAGDCEIVYGEIEPNGICKFWVIPNHLINEPMPISELIPILGMEEDANAETNMENDAGETEINIEVGAIEDRNTTPTERADMPDSDFVIPETRNFPIVTPGDIPAAVSSWGRYRGPISFETFKRRIIEIATAKGPEFFARLPESWKLEIEQRKSYVRELLQVMGVQRD